MTTAADVLRAAREVHDAGLIYRQPYGWGNYVSIQQQPPYPPEHFGRMSVEHCGISVAHVYHRAGLRVPGIPPYHVMQYTPALYTWRNSPARVGAAGCMNWHPGDGVQDHIVLVVGGEHVDAAGFVTGGYIDVWEANTDASGRSKYTRYSPQYFEGFHYPRGLTAAPAPTPAPAPTARRRPPGDGMTTLHKVPLDDRKHGDPQAAHNTYISDAAGLRWHNPDEINEVTNGFAVQWHTKAGWTAWFDNYCRAWHGNSAAVVLSKKCGCPLCKK